MMSSPIAPFMTPLPAPPAIYSSVISEDCVHPVQHDGLRLNEHDTLVYLSFARTRLQVRTQAAVLLPFEEWRYLRVLVNSEPESSPFPRTVMTMYAVAFNYQTLPILDPVLWSSYLPYSREFLNSLDAPYPVPLYDKERILKEIMSNTSRPQSYQRGLCDDAV